ncbi:transposase [Nonomuraea sp. KC401]|uniref:transposase n=1 Tax=unclassified Nonomuraea TaxID=2593643 RepID=UPI0010FD566B|nr:MULTISPECIES: transposase [unclassified Nonomuraea]NBE97509.1 hypothetical protein [Nonomuraea sp. K271]TLF62629.1 transposase [Nonomuraea sp. KC401]
MDVGHAPPRIHESVAVTLGLLLVVIVTAASVQDRDGAKPALERLRDWYERIKLVRAGSAYAGKLVTWARKHVRLALEIVKRGDDVSGFVVLPGPPPQASLYWLQGRAPLGRTRRPGRSPRRRADPHRRPPTTRSRPESGCSATTPPTGRPC